MGNRRKARELAMQALFSIDFGKQDATDEALAEFTRNFSPGKKTKEFFEDLVKGVSQNRSRIDGLIERFSLNWKIGRMGGVDRNVLRVAVYELLYRPDIPFKVAINEAIDIGKLYGASESGAFINGILDRIRIALENNELKKGVDF